MSRHSDAVAFAWLMVAMAMVGAVLGLFVVIA